MSIAISHIPIEFKPEWFQSGYFVYILTIKHKGKKTYYIGQTGDRYHTSSRSPYYRLWGHLNPYNINTGSDSQLFKGLLKIIGNRKKEQSNRIKVEQAMASGDIELKADYFKIKEMPNNITRDEHIEYRKLVEDIETSIIQSIPKEFLINKKHLKTHSKVVTNDKAKGFAEKIMKNLSINKQRKVVPKENIRITRQKK